MFRKGTNEHRRTGIIRSVGIPAQQLSSVKELKILLAEFFCKSIFNVRQRSQKHHQQRERLIPRPRNNRSRRHYEPAFKANHHIRAPEIRVIDVHGEPLGVMRTRDAMKMAVKQELDLIEISGSAKPPVCKIVDYGRYKYEMDKKTKENKKNATTVKVKEVKYHANTEEHDYETKMRHIKKFLADGNRVKCSLYFRGRENIHHDIGFKLFKRIEEEIEEFGQVEQTAKLQGKSLTMLLSTKRKKK